LFDGFQEALLQEHQQHCRPHCGMTADGAGAGADDDVHFLVPAPDQAAANGLCVQLAKGEAVDAGEAL